MAQLLARPADRFCEGPTVKTAEQYAASMVEQYQVVADTGSPAHRAADAVIPVVKQWGNQYLQGITLSGAYAKHTAISLASHVDILISLNPVPDMEMRTIFWNLFEYLTNHDLEPCTRHVSMQVKSKGLNVDLIPAFRDGAGTILFHKKSGTAVHTDVTQHLHLVGTSGRTQEICALKIWRERNELEFPSLYLELTALHALEGERFGQLADNVLTVLRYLSSRFVQAVMRDPANPDNLVSDDLTAAEKKKIAKAAGSVLYDENWMKILW